MTEDVTKTAWIAAAERSMTETAARQGPVLAKGSGDEAQWYALRVLPQKEFLVAYLLRKQGVRTFVPTETRFRRRTRYVRSKTEFAHPVIPGCVFAGFDGSPAWFNVLKNRAIIGPEGMDGHPWRLQIEGRDGLFSFLASTIDGCLVIEGGQRLIHVQGRGMVRSPTTQVRTISPRKRRDPDAPIAVEATGRRARLLARFVIPEPAALMMAAE